MNIIDLIAFLSLTVVIAIVVHYAFTVERRGRHPHERRKHRDVYWP
jgi:hypothetical protein